MIVNKPEGFMHPRYIRCLACCMVLVLAAGSGLYAKKKDKEKNQTADTTTEASATAGAESASSDSDTQAAVEVSGSGELDLSSSFAFKNGGTSGAVDWVESGGGPSFDLDGEGSLDFEFAAASWFRTGALFESSVSVDTDSKSPLTNEPYLVIDSADISALASWYVGAKWDDPGFSGSVKLTMDGGIRVLDLNEADFTYQPTASEGKDFWYRVLPQLGSTQKVGTTIANTLDLSVRNRFLAWWDAETSYGRNWNLGYKDSLKAQIDVLLAKDKQASWSLGIDAKAEWDTTLVTPTEDFELALSSKFKFSKVGDLKLVPLYYEYQATVPGFDAAQAQDMLNQLGGKVEWESKLDHAGWSMAFEWPWTAWAATSATAAEGIWKLSCAVNLLD